MTNAFVDLKLSAAGFDADAVTRIRAILDAPQEQAVSVGPLEIDPRTRRVAFRGIPVGLSQKEFELLYELAQDPERVFTKQELLRTIWGFRTVGRTRTLDAHASRLRRKLADAVPGERVVVNVWGVGYRLLDA